MSARLRSIGSSVSTARPPPDSHTTPRLDFETPLNNPRRLQRTTTRTSSGVWTHCLPRAVHVHPCPKTMRIAHPVLPDTVDNNKRSYSSDSIALSRPLHVPQIRVVSGQQLDHTRQRQYCTGRAKTYSRTEWYPQPALPTRADLRGLKADPQCRRHSNLHAAIATVRPRLPTAPSRDPSRENSYAAATHYKKPRSSTAQADPSSSPSSQVSQRPLHYPHVTPSRNPGFASFNHLGLDPTFRTRVMALHPRRGPPHPHHLLHLRHAPLTRTVKGEFSPSPIPSPIPIPIATPRLGLRRHNMVPPPNLADDHHGRTTPKAPYLRRPPVCA
ncbi:hypothetical protein C8J57DRAFT_1603133 [Mycena rebaudengoi]|nr:hypothetical protein C8J57DRAFT_1603133 [Mycena rebaudengoi]